MNPFYLKDSSKGKLTQTVCIQIWLH
jgi:hypothetical protein